MPSTPRCRATGGVLNCKRADCPEKLAERETFFATLPKTKVPSAEPKPLPSFASEGDLVAYVAKKYRGKVEYEVQRYCGRYGMEFLNVDNINVAPELRGKGIALRIRRMLQRYADQHDLVIVGNPNDQGDGTVAQARSSKAYKQHCIAHRERLVRAYFTTGYCHNPFFDYRNSGFWWRSGGAKDKNPLLNKFVVKDFEVRDRFSTRGSLFLKDLDEFVYFPNGRIPEWMLADGADASLSGWHRPEDADTREEQESLHRAQYEAQLARQAA